VLWNVDIRVVPGSDIDTDVDRVRYCAKSSYSPKLPFTIKPDAEHGGRWPSALDALR
jgi:hypothetical protein